MDRRRSRRFDMRAPAIWRSKDAQASHETGGFTRDVSSGGVFILSSVPPAEGTPIDLEVLLPPLETSSQELKLQCEGVVVRVEREAAPTGFAVRCNFERAYVIGALTRGTN